MQATLPRHNIQKHTNHYDYAGDGTLFSTKCSFYSLVIFSFILDIGVGCSVCASFIQYERALGDIICGAYTSSHFKYNIYHRFRIIIIYGWFCYCRTNAIHFNADKRTNKWKIWIKKEEYAQALKCTHYVRITSSLYIVCVVVASADAAADFLCS